VQGLRAGQSLTLNFAVASVDGTPSNVAITVTGTDDVPVIAGKAIGAVTEDVAVGSTGLLTDSGTLTISDADTGQASFQTTGITA
ncbi:VCBS domain-containing protein, partial [Chitinimonas sp. PSY-7]|uniref:VCBS domain-containing protein n=1 Tax=Chitinimonas sp. PSY-7 TaxID=3459088 RepID=UPI004040277C